MSKEAMTLALEALSVWEDMYPQYWDELDDKAITALREELAKPDFWEGYVPEPDKRQQALDKKAENARELGLDYEPAQQEPVKVVSPPAPWGERILKAHPQSQPQYWPDALRLKYMEEELTEWRAAFAPQAQPAQQEPVAYLCENAVGHQYFRWKKPSSTYKPIALYTSPPAQRTWVELTDEEKSDIWCVVTNRDFVTEDTHVYADAIEAKIKEKNT